MRLLVDNHEPDPHPWERYLPEGARVERGTLETGDIALAALPEGAVVERKTPGDLVSCIGGERERFERELKRGRYCGRMVVVVEGSLADVVVAGTGVASQRDHRLTRRMDAAYCPFVFTGSERIAADFAFRFLAAQVRDIQRLARASAVVRCS